MAIAGVQVIVLTSIAWGQPGGIRLEEVILTSRLNENSKPQEPSLTFSPDDSRIYCYILARSWLGDSLSASTVVKWYYETGEREQITAHYFTIYGKEPALIWLEPREGERFRQGNYTVEILINSTPVETVKFVIE